jgi:hypothetical protein
VSEVFLVLDTAALLAYAYGTDDVGELMVEAADSGSDVLIPATCLASAYHKVFRDGWDYLDVLATLPQTVVAPLTAEQCAVVGGWARTLGLDTAHAAFEAAAHPVVPLMTDRRELAARFLPKGWPIIDV